MPVPHTLARRTEGASPRRGRPLAHTASIEPQSSVLWRDLACRRQAIQGNGEEAPAVRPRHSSSPPTDGALQWGAWDAIQYSNDRSSHDKEQRTGAVHHDGVSNTVCYLINVRDWLLTRHCLRKFSSCARDCHSLVASSIQTIGMRLDFAPAIRRRDVPPHILGASH